MKLTHTHTQRQENTHTHSFLSVCLVTSEKSLAVMRLARASRACDYGEELAGSLKTELVMQALPRLAAASSHSRRSLQLRSPRCLLSERSR